MPTYQYACTACGHELEAVQSFTDDPLTQCPECEGRLRKRFGSVGVVFKGSGFYRTDSRAASNGKSGGSSSNGKSSSSESSSGESGSGSSSDSGSSSGPNSSGGSAKDASTGSSSGSGKKDSSTKTPAASSS